MWREKEVKFLGAGWSDMKLRVPRRGNRCFIQGLGPRRMVSQGWAGKEARDGCISEGGVADSKI